MRNTTHSDFSLRLMGISAPHWVRRSQKIQESFDLKSKTPFSLQNALRVVTQEALKGGFGDCNWSQKRLLKDSFILSEYWEDERVLIKEKLIQVRPTVLFIGCMTLSFPGAVRVATLAKELLGDSCQVILGGKHANETFSIKNGKAFHHTGSPLVLMAQGLIPRIFDLVVSGEGEYISLEITRFISGFQEGQCDFDFSSISKKIPGSWTAGWVDALGVVRTTSSLGVPIDRDALPFPVEVFGINSNFPIFQTEYTAHVYSDTGMGCVKDCFFCSERRSLGGEVKLASSAQRLHRQLLSTEGVGKSQFGPKSRGSAFCDDSILLGGSRKELVELNRLLVENSTSLSWGGQLTVDDLCHLRTQEVLLQLKDQGLSYLFVGMETLDEEVAKSMSKNSKKKVVTSEGSWLDRNEQAISFATRTGLDYGVAILWGLGESQETRVAQLALLKKWQQKYQGNPKVVSLNWATQHPLLDQAPGETFLEWGTDPESELLPIFQEMFGEVSEKYCIASPPTKEELLELKDMFLGLDLRN